MHALGELARLGLHLEAADHDAEPQLEMAGEGRKARVNLHRQFPRRHQDQRLHRLGGQRKLGLKRVFSRSGKPKAAVFPVPVWAIAMRSVPSRRMRDGLGLDRGWRGSKFSVRKARSIGSERPNASNDVWVKFGNLSRGGRR